MNVERDDALHDAGPPPALRAALRSLPVERALPPSGLAQLNAALARSRTSAAETTVVRSVRRRRMIAVATVGAAALLTIALLTRSQRTQTVAVQRDASSVLLPVERTDPRVRAVLDGTRAWQAAVSDSVRSARWPREAERAVEQGLLATDRALADVRSVLRRDSTNAVALEALTTLRARQLTMLQSAMTLLDEL
jgi:hypothetical protein